MAGASTAVLGGRQALPLISLISIFLCNINRVNPLDAMRRPPLGPPFANSATERMTMRHSRRAKTLLFATTCAVFLGVIPSAQAGNGWGWKKPMNQRLGAFYTSNKAFKSVKSSSSSYRHSTSYRRYTVTPTYSQPSTRTVTVQPAPGQQAQIQVRPAQGQIPSTPPQTQLSPPQTQLSPTPIADTSRVAPNGTTTGVSPGAKAVQQDTRSVEERALELLGP